MKLNWKNTAVFTAMLMLMAPVTLLAQEKEKSDKEIKEEKTKKDVQQIVITRKGDKEGKVVVEINGDNITVNGKPLEEYKDKNGDLNVKLNKLRDLESLTYLRGGAPMAGWNMNGNGDNNVFFKQDDNRAMLGVTTEKTEGGAQVQDVTKESAAEKIGLKEDDIITRIGDKKIEGPDDLSEAIKAHKPGDKVSVTYLRDKKEHKAEAELTKWKGVTMFGSNSPMGDFKIDLDGLNNVMPRVQQFRNFAPNGGGMNWSWSGGSPKLGLSVQDTDDGKGVKVIEVDEESNAAKAGIKEEDIITQLDDKAVNGVDEISKLLREKKDNPTVRFQVTRGGKSQNIEVKMPRKIKTADL